MLVADRRVVLVTNGVVLVLLLALFAFNKGENAGASFLLALAPIVSLVAFVGETNSRTLLAICGGVNAFIGFLMLLAAVSALVAPFAQGMFLLAFVVLCLFASVQIYSALVSFRAWSAAGNRTGEQFRRNV